jgi:hypothetical protein
VLEALDVGSDQLLGQGGVLAEGAVDATPARLGGEVGLRGKRHVDPHGPVFLPGDVAEPSHECRVTQGGEPERFWPLRELRRLHARAKHLAEVVSRIGTDRDGDAESASLRDLLQRIVLGRKGVGRTPEARDHAVHVGVDDERPVGRRVVLAADAGTTHRSAGARGAMHHRAGLLLDRHVSDEIAGASLGGETPVLIGVEHAVAVEVLETQAVVFEDRGAPRAQVDLSPQSGDGDPGGERECDEGWPERGKGPGRVEPAGSMHDGFLQGWGWGRSLLKMSRASRHPASVFHHCTRYLPLSDVAIPAMVVPESV